MVKRLPGRRWGYVSSEDLGGRIGAGRGDAEQGEGAGTWAEPGDELVLGGPSLSYLLPCSPSTTLFPLVSLMPLIYARFTPALGPLYLLDYSPLR